MQCKVQNIAMPWDCCSVFASSMSLRAKQLNFKRCSVIGGDYNIVTNAIHSHREFPTQSRPKLRREAEKSIVSHVKMLGLSIATSRVKKDVNVKIHGFTATAPLFS